MVRVWDMGLKGHRFESLQKQWENFFLQSQISVWTYFGICSAPVLLEQPVKDPGHSA